jgi:hypothetical protein
MINSSIIQVPSQCDYNERNKTIEDICEYAQIYLYYSQGNITIKIGLNILY